MSEWTSVERAREARKQASRSRAMNATKREILLGEEIRGAFPSMDLKLGYFQPITKPASLFVESAGGTTFGSSNTGVPQFFLGGPVRLSAYGQNEFQGNQYYLFRAG